MAKTGAQQQLYAELLERYGHEVADAFFRAIDDLRAGVELQRVVAALENGDIEGALDALHIEHEAYSPLREALRETYLEGGRTAVAGLPRRRPDGSALVIRFDIGHPQAERWLTDHSSGLITRITDDQRFAVRTKLKTAMGAGQNPRTTALDVVGRVNRATGKREGGVLGLTTTQAGYVESAAAELASGDPADLRHYLTRTRRDKRFDRSIAKAIREEKPLPADIQFKARTAYERRLLQLRGETIGNVETFNALAEARNQTFVQGIEAGHFSADMVTIRWRHFGNDNPRLQHVAMNGKTIRFGELFVLPDGTPMRFPHDPNAPISHTAGCHCQGDYRVDFLATVV